ncbi:hypothetical protein MRX96_043158 [Rhipicephalus microplus]
MGYVSDCCRAIHLRFPSAVLAGLDHRLLGVPSFRRHLLVFVVFFANRLFMAPTLRKSEARLATARPSVLVACDGRYLLVFLFSVVFFQTHLKKREKRKNNDAAMR